MESITNFKLKEFFKQDYELQQEYIQVLKLLKPVETKLEVFHLKLKDVEFIKQNLTSDNDDDIIEIISKVQDIKLEDVYELGIVEIFGLIASVKEQLEQIIKAEQSSLVSENTNIKWEAVNGSERIAKFGIYNTLNTLSQGDILKWEAIMNLEYADVFMKLLLDKTNNDLQQEMQNIKLK